MTYHRMGEALILLLALRERLRVQQSRGRRVSSPWALSLRLGRLRPFLGPRPTWSRKSESRLSRSGRASRHRGTPLLHAGP